MIVFDTDIISIWGLKEGESYHNLSERISRCEEDERICTTIVNFEKQMRGWLSYIAASRTISRQVDGYASLHRLLRSYQLLEVLDFDSSAAERFEQLRRSRIKIGTMDLKIAAIALVHEATLVSRNLNDFRRVHNLRVEDWARPL